MEFEVLMFWLIHALILFLMPALMYFGCCRDEYEDEIGYDMEVMKFQQVAADAQVLLQSKIRSESKAPTLFDSENTR